MPLDLVSVLAAGVVGGLSGVTFASLKTGQEEKAKRRALARDNVHQAVGIMLADVVAYQAKLGRGHDDETSRWILDYAWASQVVVAARRLGPIRQHLIERRLKRLVGKVASDLAFARPTLNDQEAFGIAVGWSTVSGRNEQYPEGVPSGLIAAGLSATPDSKKVTMLKRELNRLASCW